MLRVRHHTPFSFQISSKMEKDLVMNDSGGKTSGLQFVPTCWEKHPLKLGQNSEESSGYICNGCGVSPMHEKILSQLSDALAPLETILESEL